MSASLPPCWHSMGWQSPGAVAARLVRTLPPLREGKPARRPGLRNAVAARPDLCARSPDARSAVANRPDGL